MFRVTAKRGTLAVRLLSETSLPQVLDLAFEQPCSREGSFSAASKSAHYIRGKVDWTRKKRGVLGFNGPEKGGPLKEPAPAALVQPKAFSTSLKPAVTV